MTQQPPTTGVVQAGLPPLTTTATTTMSHEQQQQPQAQPPAPLSAGGATSTHTIADGAPEQPGVTDAVTPPVGSAAAAAAVVTTGAFSPTMLKGIAASALEQPSQPSPSLQLQPQSQSQPQLLTQPQIKSQQQQLPSPFIKPQSLSLQASLKIATDFSPVLTGKPLTPTSYHAEPVTATHRPTNMGSHFSKLVGSVTTPRQSHPQQQQQAFRHLPGTSGKRPSMRQVSNAQDDLTPSERAARTHKIRDIINEQFGLEILLKHRELQDIEAELGRAEACLEQIRRCSIEEAMEKDGRFDDPSGFTMAYAPAPEVMNGPYSRDYRDWLMEERVSTGRSKYHDVLAKDQSRNFVIQRRGESVSTPHAQIGRPQREATVAAAAVQSQKRATICLHRQPDGTIVRLTCIDCKRDQFGSMQGFINHCRLAHQRDFQTHDHAAAVCGAPFDLTGYAGTLPPPRSNKASKYVSSSVPPAGSRTTKSGSSAKNSAKATKKKTSAAVIADESSVLSTGPLTPPLQAEDITLRKTIQTSHLKEYLGKKRIDVDNLDTMVEEALNRVGIVEEESEADDEAEDEDEKVVVVASGTNKKKQKVTPKVPTATTATTKVTNIASAAVGATDPQVAPQPEVQLAPPAGVPQTEPPAAVRQPSPARDVVMMDLTIDTSVGNNGSLISTNDQTTPGSGAVDSAYEGSEAIVDLSEPSIQVIIPAKGEDGEQTRPVSRRSNPGSSRQSPRTPVAPTLPTRMGTRAHPSPENENSSVARYSTRLADVVKASPGPKNG
ncbi:hypothetical protein TWF730_002354 [Orbilia blumenaviensis]|uniref:AHC1-like C2H2 zinc-finger domain-containing protein n=1 Tax=Orbilia blumenaviensis TaxID=1796055 RepID=A0AAV9UE49_9PEZI